VVDYEYIDRYIHNELSDSEKTAFEQQLNTDAEFAEAYQLYASIENTMQNDSQGNQQAFIEKLQPLQEKYFLENPKQKKGKLKKILFIGLAATALLVLVFTLIPFNNTPKTSEALYAQYAIYEKVDPTTRGDNDSILNKAAALYNEKNYAAAVPYLEKIKKENASALFLLAVCNVEIKNYTAAIAHFDILINGTSSYKDKAQWYKALSYLKQDNKAECKNKLLSITNNSAYFKDATALLKEL
jgi:tetratricopeptide (TPR) repeat protein